jgi:mono/diheme cytochrome c family protein
MRRCWRYRLAAGVCSIATAAFLAAACWGQESTEEWKVPLRAARKKNPIPADEKSIAAGKVVYVKECLSCHGTKGVGDGPGAKDLTKPPGDLTSAKVQQQTDGAIFYKVTEGRKPMPATDKTLTDDQRWQVVDYIRTFAPKGVATQAAATQSAGGPSGGAK